LGRHWAGSWSARPCGPRRLLCTKRADTPMAEDGFTREALLVTPASRPEPTVGQLNAFFFR
jgi:hypothetical protein